MINYTKKKQKSVFKKQLFYFFWLYFFTSNALQNNFDVTFGIINCGNHRLHKKEGKMCLKKQQLFYFFSMLSWLSFCSILLGRGHNYSNFGSFPCFRLYALSQKWYLQHRRPLVNVLKCFKTNFHMFGNMNFSKTIFKKPYDV